MASPPDLQPDETGSLVGGYELVLRLATEPAGAQYLARMKQAGGVRIVVLERFRADLPDADAFSDQLLQDTATVSKIRQLNVVTPVAFGGDRGPFVATEAIEALSLRDLCEAAGSEKLPAAIAVRIGIDVLTGLNALHHQRGPDGKSSEITHGALSPAAILLASDGSARLTQLGSGNARALLRASDGEPGGAEVPYLAPELIDGGPVVCASDIFATAAIVWELLTGKAPFGASADAASRDRSQPIAAVSTLATGIPAKLDAALARALDSEPRKRFATVLEFSRALESAGVPPAPRTAVAILVARILRDKIAIRREQVRQARVTATLKTPARTTAVAAAGPADAAAVAVVPAATVATVSPADAPVVAAASPADAPVVAAVSPADGAASESGAEVKPAFKLPVPVAMPVPRASVFPKPAAVSPATPAVAPAPLPTVAPVVAPAVAPESTLQVALSDVIAVSNEPPPVPAKKTADTTMPVTLADLKEVPSPPVPPAHVANASAAPGGAIEQTARPMIAPRGVPAHSEELLSDDAGPAMHQRAVIARLLETPVEKPSAMPVIAADADLLPSSRPEAMSRDLEAVRDSILPPPNRRKLIAGLIGAGVVLIVGVALSMRETPATITTASAREEPTAARELVNDSGVSAAPRPSPPEPALVGTPSAPPSAPPAPPPVSPAPVMAEPVVPPPPVVVAAAAPTRAAPVAAVRAPTARAHAPAVAPRRTPATRAAPVRNGRRRGHPTRRRNEFHPEDL